MKPKMKLIATGVVATSLAFALLYKTPGEKANEFIQDLHAAEKTTVEENFYEGFDKSIVRLNKDNIRYLFENVTLDEKHFKQIDSIKKQLEDMKDELLTKYITQKEKGKTIDISLTQDVTKAKTNVYVFTSQVEITNGKEKSIKTLKRMIDIEKDTTATVDNVFKDENHFNQFNQLAVTQKKIDTPLTKDLVDTLYIEKGQLHIQTASEKTVSISMKDAKPYINDMWLQKQMALTFDDGPSKFTPALLDLLRQYNAKATFFVLGNQVEKNSETLKQIVEEGHAVGNHTWNHPQLTKISGEKVKEEMDKTDEIIKKVTGLEEINLMRPPYGAINQNTMTHFKDKKVILWDVDSWDWKTRNTASVIKQVEQDFDEGDIILMHDLYQSTLEAAEHILKTYSEQGYEFVTIDELYEIKK